MKKALSLILVLTIIFASCSCEKKKEAVKYSETFLDCFDTAITFTAYSETKEEFDTLYNRAHFIFTYYHRLFDIYNTYENVHNAKTINDAAGKDAIMVDEQLTDLVILGKELYESTGGKINIALGVITKMWKDAGEASDTNAAYIPSPEDLQIASEYCSIDDVIADKNQSTVYLINPNMRLDIGAIAKGYATQLVAEQLIAEGHYSFLISAGGNIKAVGAKPDGSPWTIGIQNPDKNSSDFAATINVINQSVVTSGTYERYFVYNGVQYHHIIDSESLMPENRYLSVSIVTEDSGYADAYSTAVFNMELDEGREFIESLEGVEAMWILNNNQKIYSSGFQALIKN